MIIIYGNGADRSILGEIGEHDCPECGQTTPFITAVDYKFFHIYYLFSLVYSKKFKAICANCGHDQQIEPNLVKSRFPKDNIPVVRKYGALAICAVIVFLIALAGISGARGSKARHEELMRQLQSPAINDVYIANLVNIEGSGFDPKNGKKQYGTLKVAEREEGDLTLLTSDKAYEKLSDLRKAIRGKKVEYDPIEPVFMTVEELKQYAETKNVLEVVR